jgi:Protein of unknown function (DUF2809)
MTVRSSKQVHARYRLAAIATMVAVVPIGYWVRFHGPGPEWFNDALGSVAYEVFWIALFWGCFVGRTFGASPLWKSQRSPFRISFAVFLATCGLEFLQLWQPPFLQALRATIPGRLVLGNTFGWTDFPPYMAGSALGYLWVQFLSKALRI